jgi:outer membrane protein assembly factor BamB
MKSRAPLACRRSAVAGVFASFFILNLSTANADWPQWRGPNRDDVSSETGLLKSWPKEGPAKLWMFDNCGVGYSGPAVVKDRLYILGARGETEFLLAIDVSSGKELWDLKLGEKLGNNWGDGPRSTPSVDGDNIYALSAKGDLACADKSGKLLWKKSLVKDLGGKVPNWGYSESPLVLNDKVICTPGGEKGSIVALNKKTGDLLWQATDLKSDAHYASAVPRKAADGKLEIVQLLPDQGVGVDAETGKVRWTTSWGKPVAAIPTPVIKDNLIYFTSGYGVGCKLVEISPENKVQIRYENKEMKNKHGGVILLDGHIYGHSDKVGWMCQDFQTGEAVWRDREKKLEMGSVTYADGRMYCLGEDTGDVVLVEPSTEGWKEHGRFTLSPQTDQRKPAGKIWTHPVVSDGKLYIRDQNLLFSFDVRQESNKTASK